MRQGLENVELVLTFGRSIPDIDPVDLILAGALNNVHNVIGWVGILWAWGTIARKVVKDLSRVLPSYYEALANGEGLQRSGVFGTEKTPRKLTLSKIGHTTTLS